MVRHSGRKRRDRIFVLARARAHHARLQIESFEEPF
jgi:hypothetical protein